MGNFSSKMSKERPFTVNCDRYQVKLNKFLFTKIEEEDIDNIWFQQDGAKCPIAVATLDVLRPVFKDYCGVVESVDNFFLFMFTCI